MVDASLLLRASILALVSVLLAPAARAQVVNPADAQKPPSQEADLPDPSHLHSWELPASVVTPERVSALREEDRIGTYGQPRWTARRLFPTTRVYVRPAGQIEFEHWSRIKIPREGDTTVENQYEVEMGLGGRTQLDLYLVTEKTGETGELETSEQKFEVRYALADWGVIPANPTLYLEWVERSGAPDKIEGKVLLGGEMSEGWHWGSNLVLEAEVAGEREHEWGLTLGVAHTMIDERLSLGAELEAALVDTAEDRGDFTKELEVGPSLQYRPVPAMHLDFAPLIGIGGDSRQADIFLVLGWEF